MAKSIKKKNKKKLVIKDTPEQEIIKFLTKRISDLKKKMNFGDKVARDVPHSELIKLHWVVGYKEMENLSWKEVMKKASLGMIFTREYKRVLWKLHEQKNLPESDESIKRNIIDEASEYDPFAISVEEHLEEIARFHPQIEDDDEFEEKYRELYNIHMEDFLPIRADSIRRKLCHHFELPYKPAKKK